MKINGTILQTTAMLAKLLIFQSSVFRLQQQKLKQNRIFLFKFLHHPEGNKKSYVLTVKLNITGGKLVVNALLHMLTVKEIRGTMHVTVLVWR